MKKIRIVTRLSFKDYLKVNFSIFYSNWAIRILTGIGIFLILMTLIPGAHEEFPWMLFLIASFFVLFLPISVYFQSKKNFKTNKPLNKQIIYEIDNTHILSTGHSFNTKLTWEAVHKITETKNFLLIWQNKQSVNILPKRGLTSENLAYLNEISNQKVIK